MARPVDPRLWRYARSARPYLVVSVLLSLLTTGCIVVAAVALARVLAGVITDPGRRTLGAWAVELAVFAVAVGCRAAATWWQSRLAHRAGARVVAELEQAVLAAGADLPPRELDARRTELAVVVGNGLSGLRAYLAGYLPALLLAVLVPPIVLAVIAAHDLTAGAIILVTLPLIPVFMILIGLMTQGRAAATLAATTRLSDQLLDLFAGMPTLRALGRESATGTGDSGHAAASAARRASLEWSASGASGLSDRVAPPVGQWTQRDRVRALGESLHARTMSALRVAFLSSMVLEMLATLCVALVAVSIGMRLVFGNMGLYAGLLGLILAPEVYLPLRAVGERFHAAQDGMAAAARAFAVLEPAGKAGEPSECAGASRPAGAGGRDIGEAPGVIEIRNLTVRGRDGSAPGDLSAVLRPGSFTVLAGPNGCGKSTALQAILGLIAPDRGEVTVGGVPVPELGLERWWARVAWLPQRPVLLPGTLRENLELFGARPEAPASGPARVVGDLEAACAATGFDAVLDELPDGWDTLVGTGGVGLSLGQRQRLALTRVLAADRPVLLLDEPTAHLDDVAEAAVLAALTARARAGATVVVVAHRPTILAVADHVVEVHADATDSDMTPDRHGDSGSGARVADSGDMPDQHADYGSDAGTAAPRHDSADANPGPRRLRAAWGGSPNTPSTTDGKAGRRDADESPRVGSGNETGSDAAQDGGEGDRPRPLAGLPCDRETSSATGRHSTEGIREVVR